MEGDGEWSRPGSMALATGHSPTQCCFAREEQCCKANQGGIVTVVNAHEMRGCPVGVKRS